MVEGFHPRHFAMLQGEQVEAAIGLLSFVEKVGLTPSVVQAIFAIRQAHPETQGRERGEGLHEEHRPHALTVQAVGQTGAASGTSMGEGPQDADASPPEWA